MMNIQPNDRAKLEQTGIYDIYALKLMRNVFPRIINEGMEKQREVTTKPANVRDAVVLYMYLHAYIYKGDATSGRFGAAFMRRKQIANDLGMNPDKVTWLSGILEANGLIRTVEKWEKTTRFKFYFPSYCPQISEDGYIIDEDGEKVIPEPEIYLTAEQRRKAKKDAETRII